MFAEMTPRSHCSLEISRTESRSKDQRRTKSTGFNCLTFCFTDQAKMEQREPPLADGTQRRLRELTSKWFIDTQVPLIAHNGLFPTWFLGFTSRKGAEEILRQKELGCFLIRLSDKAIGYILSYKGNDRCRHFVINQSESGHFVICGDTEEHSSVSDLIEYYKTSPIQPFGEFLTTSCFETLNEELYDNIQVSNKESSVNTAVRITHNSSEQPPMRPPKNSGTLDVAPPLPRRSRHLDINTLNDKERVFYAQFRKQSPREKPTFRHYSQESTAKEYPGIWESTTGNIKRSSATSGTDPFLYNLGPVDNKNPSVSFLGDSCNAERPYRPNATPHTPPRLSPKDISHTTCYGLQKTVSYNRPISSHRLEYASDDVIYHLAGRPGNLLSESNAEQHRDSVYAEVAIESHSGYSPQTHTYEIIPDDEDAVSPTANNTYEPLEDIRPKHNDSTWGLKVCKNDKWRRLFPEAKRK